MRFIVLSILNLIFATDATSGIGIAGKWKCTVLSNPPTGNILSFDLDIDEREVRFKRVGHTLIKTDIPAAPTIEFSTVEEGRIYYVDDRITLSPLYADLKILQGSVVFTPSVYQDFLESVKEDEVGTLDVINESTFKVTITHENSVQTNTCQKFI